MIVNKDFYALSAQTPSGKTIAMQDYQGKVVLIVNTATKCGLSPQLEGLEKLYQKYSAQGLVVLGFPCAQFLNQEPETNATVEEACKLNFGVTFPLSKKIEVNGKNTHEVFHYLKRKLRGGIMGSGIKWNFTKFLITAEGKPFKRYAPTVKPEAMEKDIVKLLAEVQKTK